jgi:hypothetical protein
MIMQRSLVLAAILIGLGVDLAAAAPPDELQPRVQTSSDAAPVAPPARAQAAPASTAPAAPQAPRAGAQPQAGAQARAEVPTPAAPVPRAPAQVSAVSAASAAAAARGVSGPGGTDSIQLDTTQISGNRELPKLMYVVPWRRDQLGNFVGRPPNSLVDEALTPVDRAVFERQNRYYAALQAGAAAPAGAEPARSQPAAAAGSAAAVRGGDEK